MTRKTTPIGPLALALRRGGAARRTVLLLAAVACAALLVGIGVLLLT